MKAWLVGVTKHQREFYAASQLREQSFLAYLAKLYRHPTDEGFSGKPHDWRFTGYIFVRSDGSDAEVNAINHTKGMDDTGGSALLQMNGKPVSIPDGIIEDLRVLEDFELDRAKSRKKPEPRTDLEPGEEVIINNPDHPAHGFRGKFLGSDRGIARVLAGFGVWDVIDADLRKIERKKVKAA